MKSGTRYGSLAASVGLALLLAACDRSEQPDPEPTVTGSQTSIIREGFEDPAASVVPLSPLEARIPFADGEDELTELAIANLETILNSPQIAAGGPIVLRAHSDAGGPHDINMEMSETRGNLVRDWLIDRGIAETRVEVIAFGEQNPIRPNANPDGTPNEANRAANRRVDITIGIPREVPRPTIAEQIGGEATEEQIEPELDETS